MKVFKVRNVNQAMATVLPALIEEGEIRSSRNGTVLAFPTAVSTVYENPTERVLFSPIRNANPTFHLLEALWMLAGRNDVAFPSTIVKNMRSFTDDGESYWGAYGWRWRSFFGWDQIEAVIQELYANPESRRVVLSMWNGMGLDDTPYNGELMPDFLVGKNGGKDVPCNTHIYFDLRGGKLNMLVCCRSNDILWGAYGANAVHMSVLQEYIALALGVPVGTYTQMSNDLHLYNSKIPKQGLEALAQDCGTCDLYGRGFRPLPLWREDESRLMFDFDNRTFFRLFDRKGKLQDALTGEYGTEFFNSVVVPMTQSWLYRKTSKAAKTQAYKIAAPDWAFAMDTWLSTNHTSFRGAK